MKRHQALIPEADAARPAGTLRAEPARSPTRADAEGGYRARSASIITRGRTTRWPAPSGRGTLHRNFQGYTTDAAPALIGIGACAIGCLPQGYVQNAADVPAYMRGDRAPDRLATARGVALTGGRPAAPRR